MNAIKNLLLTLSVLLMPVAVQAQLSNPGTLAGTFQNSTATATITGLDRTAVTYLLATAFFDPPITAQAFNPKGLNHVARVRIESAIGSEAKLVFLRDDGTEIDRTKLSKKFLEQLGL